MGCKWLSPGGSADRGQFTIWCGKRCKWLSPGGSADRRCSRTTALMRCKWLSPGGSADLVLRRSILGMSCKWLSPGGSADRDQRRAGDASGCKWLSPGGSADPQCPEVASSLAVASGSRLGGLLTRPRVSLREKGSWVLLMHEKTEFSVLNEIRLTSIFRIAWTPSARSKSRVGLCIDAAVPTAKAKSRGEWADLGELWPTAARALQRRAAGPRLATGTDHNELRSMNTPAGYAGLRGSRAGLPPGAPAGLGLPPRVVPSRSPAKMLRHPVTASVARAGCHA